jgi:hypothetical protein
MALVFGLQSTRWIWVLSGLSACFGLTACSKSETVQEAFGYEQRGPDEMAVISRPPLIVPPDYNLRPPRPGENNDGAAAASEAARQTLIGPSSSLEEGPINGNDARAVLTGSEPSTSANGAASEGQNLLVSRTNRVERDLDALRETRSENRVDGAFLRELLAWDPDEQAEAAVVADGGGAGEAVAVVEVIRREQTPIQTDARNE